MPYTDCQTWKDPKSARLRQTGPLLQDHPNIRALMVCEDCGQHWIYDLLDSADWGGTGEGRVIYAPVPDALEDAGCAALSAHQIEHLAPRLVIRDTATPFERVA